MGAIERGRLLDSSAAPATGERVQAVAGLGAVRVEQILSGDLVAPADYCQDHDEWVVLLAGAARLEVAGEPLDMGRGDWVLLPAGTPHRLVRTEPGTNWLAVHLP